MIEAIGHRQLGTYFATIDRLLAPDGFAGIQSILVPDQRYKLYRSQRDWIRKHIFPGGMLPSLEAVATAARRSSGLMVHEVREIGPHYARTLREWRERFLLRRSEVEALGLDLHFQRTWEYYLAFCEAAFATHALRDAQLVLTRPLNRIARRGLTFSDPSPGARRRAARSSSSAEAESGSGPPAAGQHREAGDLGQPERERPVVLEPEDGRELGLVAELAEHARRPRRARPASTVDADLLGELAHGRRARILAEAHVARAGMIPLPGRAVLAVAAQLPEAAARRS